MGLVGVRGVGVYIFMHGTGVVELAGLYTMVALDP